MHGPHAKGHATFECLNLRSVSSLNNNHQNSEMKICESYEVDMLKIIELS
jgi:hypothetical protein